MPWTFPDEAIQRNQKGVQPLKMTPCPRPEFMSSPTSTSEHFRNKAIAEAQARVRNTSMAKAGMLGMRNTTARSQRYERPASRSAIHNGKFMASAYEYAADAGQKRGGTGLITKDGREWVHKTLQERVKQLNAIATGTFMGKPETIEVTPLTNGIDAALQPLIDALQLNFISSHLPSMAQRVQAEILAVGARIKETDLVRVYQVILNALQSIRSLTSSRREGPVPSDQSKILDLLRRSLSRSEEILKELSRIASQSQAVRQIAVNQMSRKLGIALTVGQSAEVPTRAEVQRDERDAEIESFFKDMTDIATRREIRYSVANEASAVGKSRVIKEYAEDLSIPSAWIQYLITHPEMDAGVVAGEEELVFPQPIPALNLQPVFTSSQYSAPYSFQLGEGDEEEEDA